MFVNYRQLVCYDCALYSNSQFGDLRQGDNMEMMEYENYTFVTKNTKTHYFSAYFT